jgi:dTDP-4-dehydrorhamnose reductase
MTSLIIGASGQVGSLLHQSLARKETCVGTYCRHAVPGLKRLDLRDTGAVERLVRELRPETCYLPAALTFVDYAETHPDECEEINVRGTVRLARALAEVGGVLVLFSTEHVFDNSPLPRREDEPPAARSVYARSKVQAEQAVQELLPGEHLILRTSWVYGPDPQEKNFFFRVRRTLSAGEPLIVPSDQHGQPTFGPDLARTARALVARTGRGIFHVVGPLYLSRLAWAQMIADRLGFSRRLIQGRPTRELRPDAYRPLEVRLDRRKATEFLGTDSVRSPHDGLRRLTRGPCVPVSRLACANVEVGKA